jgi:tRNA-dihydrouridine synthase
VARYLATGRREAAPDLRTQHALIDELYDALLAHHGLRIGTRHARKHLGWALDAAAATAGVSAAPLKAYRHRVLTAEDPAAVRRHLAEAFDAFGAGMRAAA